MFSLRHFNKRHKRHYGITILLRILITFECDSHDLLSLEREDMKI